MSRIKINSSILESHIMIVDDSAISRRKLKNDLNNKGFTNITEVCSGIECLERLKEVTPDLFLLDMLMPGMNGNELVKHLRELDRHSETPIIIVTVSEEEELIKECFSLGANDFLRKPWDADELSTRVVSQIERRQNIRFLRADEVRLSRALEVITDGIWECNISTKKVIFSPSCYRVLNITEDTKLDIDYVLSLIHPKDLERITKLFYNALNNNKTSLDFESRILINNNTRRWIATKVKVVKYGQGGFPSVLIGVSRDITSQVIAQRHLQKFGKEMRELAEERSQMIIHNERLAALGTMSAGIAHEISNPLSYIRGNVQLLNKTIPNIIKTVSNKVISDETKEELFNGLDSINSVLSSLEDGIRRVCDLTSTMKNFSSNRSDMTKIHDIADAIDDALLLCANHVKNGIRIVKEYKSKEFFLPFNIQQITQVLINLIINAVQAMHGCGTIKISTRKVNDELILQLEDTGPGIPDEVKEKIFSAFYTTKKEGEGTGLGLYISKNIISEHHGRLLVTSAEKTGTVFSIYLPLSDSKTPLENEEQVTENPTQPVTHDDQHNLKILIAEDDMLIQEIITQKLKVFSCDIQIANSAEAAISSIVKDTPDAIILSMSMSSPDSIIEILKEISDKNIFPPVFIIETEHYTKFPVQKLKDVLDINSFDSFEVIDSKDLSNLFS